MIVIGIIVIATAVITALLNMLFIFGSAAGEERWVVPGVVLHILCGIGSVVGLVLIALGILSKLGWA